MNLMPLQPICHTQGYTCGEVTIDPTAAISAGVLLQAEPGSRIVIAAGACLGMGVVLHAMGGTLEVGESASLGTGVLVIGAGTIGAYACVGAATTLFQVSVPPREMIPPGSLLGHPGRAPHRSETNPQPGAAGQENIAHGTIAVHRTEVYGRAYVDQMLGKLMPHRQDYRQE